MDNSVLFIFNPRAGKGKIKYHLAGIMELYKSKGYDVISYATAPDNNAESIVTNCLKESNFEYVICSGGDGTLNEIVNGVMKSEYKPKIVLIPLGTTNDYAKSLRIPQRIMKAAAVVFEKNHFSSDVGLLNTKYFVYIAAFGLFTDVSYETPQVNKNFMGRFAYILEGIKRIANLKSYSVNLEFENEQVSGEFIFGMISNSISVGGFKGITGKEVVLNDGYFEAIFIKKPNNILDLQNIIHSLTSGDLSSEFIIYAQIREICIRSEMNIPWTIDGEYGGNMQQVEVKNISQAISICTPLPVPAKITSS